MQNPTLNRQRVPLLVLFLAAMMLSRAAHAQTGAPLMVKPWPEKDQLVDSSADAYIPEGGHIKGSGGSFQMFDFESTGRFRILPGNEISPRIGYDINFIDNHTHFRGIPDQLTNTSVAFGTGIAKWDDYVAGISFGAGYAGSSAFGLGTGWYAKADLIVAKNLNENDTIGVIIDYDGNRNYLPDVPLPGIGFSHRFDPKLQVVVGAPYSSLSWKPIDHLDIEAEYQLYADFKFSVAYEFIPHWSVFGTYGYIREGFHAPDIGKDRRLLLYERRAEAGIRYEPNSHLNFKIAAGYTWDGSYRTGFDFSNTNQVADFSDEPYLHAGLEFRY